MNRLYRIMHILMIACVFLTACRSPQAPEETAVSADAAPAVHNLEVLERISEDPLAALARSCTESTDVSLLQTSMKTNNKKPYTVMIYMTGSDLESNHGAATKELQEMASLDINFRKTNVLVYTGGTRTWRAGIPSDRNTVIDLSGGAVNTVAGTPYSSNMGASGTLADFVNYAVKYYPADQYALIFWDHGSGALWGCCSDELYKYDALTLGEMKTAMDQTIFKDRKLEFVGFDACLMGNIETAALWADYAEYMIASEDLEKGDGWNYAFLEQLGKTNDREKRFAAVLQDYRNDSEAVRSSGYAIPYSLAVYDLAEAAQVSQALADLSGEIKAAAGTERYPELAKALVKMRRVGITEGNGEQYGLADIGSFAERMYPFYPEKAAALASAAEKLITDRVADNDDYSGVSLYFPPDWNTWENVRTYAQGILTGEEYVSMLDAFRSAQKNAGADVWQMNGIYETDDAYCLDLTDVQLAHLAGLSLSIWETVDDTSLTPVLMEEPVTIEGHTVKIPKDQEIFVLKSDIASGEYIQPMIRTGDDPAYVSYASGLASDDWRDTIDRLMDKYSTDINITVSVGEDGTCRISSVSEKGDVFGSGRRGTVSIPDRNRVITNYEVCFSEEQDEDGYGILTEDGIVMDYIPVDQNFRVEKQRISTLAGSFQFSVFIVDIYGNGWRTDMHPFSAAEYTVLDGIEYVRGDDGYIVAGKDDSLSSLQIPAYVNGLPVTAVAAGAFTKDSTLQEVVLPDTVREIGDRAFWGSGLRSVQFGNGLEKIGYLAFSQCQYLSEIDLPESVQMLSRHAFSYCSLKKLYIPAGVRQFDGSTFAGNPVSVVEADQRNRFYKVKDGIVYTADGDELVYCPEGVSENVKVARGTKTIGYAAFENTSVKSVTMPSSLKEIGDHAFFRCWYLRDVQLPAGLKRIGDYAFDNPSLMKDPAADEDLSNSCLHIGREVEYIGVSALSGLSVARFEVDAKNPYYASRDGFITDKAGTTLLFAPKVKRLTDEAVSIPEGITSIPYGVLNEFGTAVYRMPSSVYRFEADAFAYVLGGAVGCIFVCPSGSAAEQYAKLKNIPYFTSEDPDALPDEYLQAYQEARQYLALNGRFGREISEEGLTDYLSKDKSFSPEAVRFAADHLPVNYKAAALREAEKYAAEPFSYAEAKIREELAEDGYTEEDIAFAMENLQVDYKAAALRQAEYLCAEDSITVYSYRELVPALMRLYGFTEEEAAYARDHVHADYKRNALKTAQKYADKPYSYAEAKIREELAEDGYTEEEIAFAMENLQVDYKAAALRQAEYLCAEDSKTVYSYRELVPALMRLYGFTEEEAAYARDHVHADYKRNALKTAQKYADKPYSYAEAKIREELAEDGYTEEEIAYALSQLEADYTASALAEAEKLQESWPRSKAALIEELTKKGFTRADAEYAADALGADFKAAALQRAQYGAEEYHESAAELQRNLQDAALFTAEETEYAIANLDCDFSEVAKARAESILDFSDYSRESLRKTLVESYGFTEDEAAYAVSHIEYDFMEAAVRRAEWLVDILNKPKAKIEESLVRDDGFTAEEAAYAVSHMQYDGNQVALNAARGYVKYINLSGADLRGQLVYEGFTEAEIDYAMTHLND